jgi:hypothetical protein
MAQLRNQIPANVDNVDKIVTALLDKNVKELPTIYTKLFKKQSTGKKFERVVSYAPFGDVPQKPEGEEYATDLIQQANTKDITPLEWGMMFEVSETAEEDDLEDILAQKSKFLVFSMGQVAEKQGAAVFANGFTTQTTADGIALYSTAHTLKRGGTAKNRPSSDADLSVTSLAQAFIDLDTDTKLESGQIVMPSKGFYLHVAPANRFNAIRIVKSVKDPESAMNAVNPLSDLDITVVVNPFLTADTDAWYLVPKDKSENGLVYLERRPVYQPPPMTDARTGNRLYKLRARMVWDSVDWRNSYGTTGA